MKRFLVLPLFAVIALSGCTKTAVTDPLCDTAVRALDGAAQGVAEALACSNVAAVKATLTKPVTDLKMCAEGAQGLVGDLVCGQVSKFVVGMGVSALPTEWGCTGGAIGAEGEKLILDKCKAIVTF